MVLSRLRGWVSWSWTYLWALWFLMILVMVYMLRGPLKMSEGESGMFSTASSYFNNLTPKFYVALTGTSSLVSGIILIFEWWYFKNNTTENSPEEESDTEDIIESAKVVAECKVFRNPMALFRGAEYNRAKLYFDQEPLTFYDLNLSAQDHQGIFLSDDDSRPDNDLMSAAWRERDRCLRIQLAKQALALNPECAAAMVLLSEEDCETITEAEAMLKRALKNAEAALNSNHNNQLIHISNQDFAGRHSRKRDMNVITYIKRRLGMCARKQGRLREAAKIFKEIVRDGNLVHVLGVQDNLIEVCLEQQNYADVQAMIVRQDGCSTWFYDAREPRSTLLSYTSALLKCRSVADKWSHDCSVRRNPSSAEQNAIDALTRAIEYNPHVPQYLLEHQPIILPPEHLLRRGDTDALAYAFFHLQHWKRIDGAMNLLSSVYKGDYANRFPMTGNCYPYSPGIEGGDKELLPGWHKVSVFPRQESTILAVLQTSLCLVVCAFAIFIHHYPTNASELFQLIMYGSLSSIGGFFDWLTHYVPENIVGLFSLKTRPMPGLYPAV